MTPPIVDHACALKDFVEQQAARIQELERELAQTKKALIGPKSERVQMPSIEKELGKPPASPESRQQRRRERAQQKDELPRVRVDHKVPKQERSCPKCGNEKLTA